MFASVVLVEPALSHLGRAFTYAVPDGVDLAIGSVVRVPFRGRRKAGVVVSLDESGIEGALPVAGTLGPGLPPDVVDLAAWVAGRYCATLGEALAAAVPARVAGEETAGREAAVPEPLPADQFGRYRGGEAMVDAVRAGAPGAFLWRPLVDEARGRAVAALASVAAARGHGVLVLLPEVRVRGEVASGLGGAFGDAVAWLGSDASARDRYRAWVALRHGTRRIAAGGRGAVFAPVRDLGLVIVDDEGHASYKEGRAPRLHARTVAAERARRAGATLVLVGTPPSIDTAAGIEQGSLRGVVPQRDEERRSRPPVVVVDRRDAGDRHTPTGRTLGIVRRALEEGARAVVLTHRRGDALAALDERCRRTLPARRPARLDAAATPADLERAARAADLIVATPVIAKDLPLEAGVLAIVDVDAALARPEFRAPEEAFATWWHAARWTAGGGRVVLETAHPRHPAVVALTRWDPGVLHRAEAARREELGYPPYAALARIDVPPDRADAAAGSLRAAAPDLEVLGPAERAGRHVIVVRSRRRERLLEALGPLAAAWRDAGEPMRMDIDPWEVLVPKWRS